MVRLSDEPDIFFLEVNNLRNILSQIHVCRCYEHSYAFFLQVLMKARSPIKYNCFHVVAFTIKCGNQR
jgi:hypothetical protein